MASMRPRSCDRGRGAKAVLWELGPLSRRFGNEAAVLRPRKGRPSGVREYCRLADIEATSLQ